MLQAMQKKNIYSYFKTHYLIKSSQSTHAVGIAYWFLCSEPWTQSLLGSIPVGFWMHQCMY
jgi:hypothetical protein